MRKVEAMGVWMALAVAGMGTASAADEPFDACQVFTQAEAETVLGTAAAGETFNPKVKRPKVVTSCKYTGFKDEKPVEAQAQFRVMKTPAEASQAFDQSKLQIATKPLLVKGADAAFWSGKTGQMNVRKGRTWLIVQAGPAKAGDRDIEQARKLAEVLVPKL